MPDLAAGARRRAGGLPLLVKLAGGLSASMTVPAGHALYYGRIGDAQAFGLWAAILMALTGAMALATARNQSSNPTRSHLVALLGALALLPALAALPLNEAVSNTRFVNAYVEMVMAATTTGGTLFAPERLSESVHLWRALVAWQGGLLILVAAVAILAPLRLGGFEVTYSARFGQSARLSTEDQRADPERRVARYFRAIAPVYAGLTVLLWLLLYGAGDTPTRAAIHAMSTLATSGITAGGGPAEAPSGIGGEIIIFAFLAFAVSRQVYSGHLPRDQVVRLTQDREIRIALMIIVLVAALLVSRHFLSALELTTETDALTALRAVWGTVFTVLSFLTTTGWESADWDTARNWSGLDTPIVLLMGLALFGGGIATTAGGVKLLRIYALYEHGRREMHLLVHPHGIAGGRVRSSIPMRGVEAAWVFFMLFAITLAAVTLLLAATGLDMSNAMILAVAALTTTGPLADIALGTGPATGVGTLSDATKLIWAAAMVLGRMEALALIALFNPDFWRN
ncbi:potassium transporter TrkG [Jannaschia seohaensis]|uniref:Trk system potassium uptake protein TrkH n=1 Tax=Jannaschia seohaensis TaxID=475081 RepID=A0A2Y9AU82_9RHOB|nr:potassium transporter TrkG [Jannaschia seohaensis]PWJ19385.1 trk system potassium uptake protein TrkH [Jannaschia seohaensis]SSA46047.1 trk system potassium uptake protein TrkH [Jannaschia seohaensis]